MKKIKFLLLAVVALYQQSFGQNIKEISHENRILLNVKSIIETHFSGTKYKGIKKDFNIDDSLSNTYKLYGNSVELISSIKLKKLNNQLNNALKGKTQIKLAGKIYFDFFLDSVIVDLDYRTDDTIYKFVAMSGTPVPRKGYGAFSKRMHDFLRDQIASDKISIDSIQFIGTAKFIAEASGTIFAAKQGYLADALDNFLKREERWNPGLHSGPLVSSKVSFVLDRTYLFEKNADWPSEYGKEQMSFESLSFLSSKNQEVFYSYNFPNEGKETVISAIYDGILKKYRFPQIHIDNNGKANKLIARINENTNKHYREDTYEFKRKYFYTYFH